MFCEPWTWAAKDAEVVQLFGVSLATIKRYLKQRREEGHMRPKAIPGRPPKKRAQVEADVLPQLPKGCATSFISSVKWLLAVLHYHHVSLTQGKFSS